ncbi:hypothetical protein D9O50_00560 [Oxalobacteraceae bacterium CAVE-383]|nr:hypothetical protein D9O50_00560 [Oxalobacteraceae bacterium CAVE-383]
MFSVASTNGLIVSGCYVPASTFHRSNSLLSLASPVNDAGKDIDRMSAAVSGMSRDVKAKTAALVRQLIATRYLFTANARGGVQPRSFNWKEPIKNFQVSHRGMTRLLKEISPRMAEDERRVVFLKNFVNGSDSTKCEKKGLRDLLITQAMARQAPSDWPREAGKALMDVLRIGQWDYVDLSGASLRNTDFEGVQWPCSIMQRTNLTGCNFRHSDLSETCMENAIADGADFRHADLTGLEARGAFFIKTEFFDAITRNADFTEAHLEYATGLRFEQGARFTDARLHDVEAGWDLCKNPLLAEQTGTVASQLQTLSSIPRRHDHLHNRIVWRLLDKINRDSHEVDKFPVLTDFLLKQARCWPHEQIAGFINNVILPHLLTRWNVNRVDDKPMLEQVMQYLTKARPALDWPKYCGAVSQLQGEAEHAGRNLHRDALSSLLKAHPGIAPLATAMEEAGTEPFEECSIFMAPDLDRAIVYSNSRLRDMAEGKDSPYNGYYFVRTRGNTFVSDVLSDLDTIEICKVPMELYNVDPPSVPAVNLLAYIFEGSAFKDEFIDALTRKTMSGEIKGAAAVKQLLSRDMQLNRHLNKFLGLRGGAHINELQCQRLWAVFCGATPDVSKLVSEDNDANIARMLVCLGTLFARYSSSALFGSELESLNSLRNFAAAFMYSSYMYDASLLGKEQTASIVDTLDGKQNHLQCTDTLTGKLLGLIRARIANQADPALAICFKAIYPQAGL